MFGNIVNDQIYHIFSYSTTISSCILNSILIYALIVTKINHVGPYRWLLLLFSLVDVCISLLHTFTLPAGHMTEHGFICLPLRFINMPTSYGFVAMLVWEFLFYQTFVLLAFHYVYRFVLVCNPPWVSWIQRNPWRNWISIAVFTDLFYAGAIIVVSVTCLRPTEKFRRAFAPVLLEVYNIDLFAENLPGFLAFIFWIPLENGEKEWQTTSIFAMILVGILMSASIGVIVFCITRIVKETRIAKKHLESRTRIMQKQLFRALLWQTIIPTITTYSPLALVILSPLLFNYPMGGWGTVAMSSMQLFPMIDPFLILIFVPRFRTALPGFIRQNSVVQSKQSIEHTGDTFRKSSGVTTITHHYLHIIVGLRHFLPMVHEDSSEVFFYLLAAKVFYTVFAILSAAGIVCNSILLFTTVRSKSLRGPCNILIGSCALFDVLHQLGTFTQSSQIYQDKTMDSRTCSLIMIIPEMGVAAGSFAVLSIGIDRLLSISMSIRYRNINLPTYLCIQYIGIILFCTYNAFLMFYFYREHEVICNMPSVFHDNAVSLWAYSSAAVNVVAFMVYVVTWRLIKAQFENIEVRKMSRIFRTIVLVTIFDLSGWAITQTLVATQNFIDLPDHKRLCYVCFASIFVNLGIAVKFLVYYFTSTEYRNAVNLQFNLNSKKKESHSSNQSSS